MQDLASGSDPHPLAESHPYFAVDTTGDKIISNAGEMKRMVRSSSVRGTTSNSPEPESFDEVLPKQLFAALKDRMASIGKLVKATSEFLQALRWHGRNSSRNRRDCPLFSFVEPLHAGHIPASQYDHIFLSHNHLVAIRESVWILASFNILKEYADLKRRNSLETWKYLDGEMQNTYGDVFFIKHSAELKCSGSTILPRIAMCEKVPLNET